MYGVRSLRLRIQTYLVSCIGARVRFFWICECELNRKPMKNPLHQNTHGFFLNFSRCKMSIATAGITATLVALCSPHLSQTISRATSKVDDSPFETTKILLGINPYPKRITGVRAQLKAATTNGKLFNASTVGIEWFEYERPYVYSGIAMDTDYAGLALLHK